MKPFNLDEYLKNPSRKVVTRDGRNVRIVCTDKRGRNRPIVALIEEQNNVDEVYTLKKDGSWDISGEESINDLFFAPERHEGWINLYKCENSTKCHTSNPYDSEEKAIELGKMSDNYLKTVKIEWEA